MKSDLSIIKDKYGEDMMHLCRKLFPTILDTDGLLVELLLNHFYPNRELCHDIIANNLEINFRDFIYSLISYKKTSDDTILSPYELLAKAGYQLYECKTNEDIMKFKKYYKKDEELCTFRLNRTENYLVFFAVKENVQDIKRKDFPNPERQDLYGTSVISIQFYKGSVNTVSIKNRYNHKVYNPDATFSNNLDNIIPGLTRSFENAYNLNINPTYNSDLFIPNYVINGDGVYHKYYMQIYNKYYCYNNIIIDNYITIVKYREKEKYLFMDYFILDLMNKKIFAYDRLLNKDSFLYGICDIKKVSVVNNNGNKYVTITLSDNSLVYITINNQSQIISYVNNNIQYIGSNFLLYNYYLTYLELKNVKKIYHNFLINNHLLSSIDINQVVSIGDNFLKSNNCLENINIPDVSTIGYDFLACNKKVTNLYLPCLLNHEDNANKNINDLLDNNIKNNQNDKVKRLIK